MAGVSHPGIFLAAFGHDLAADFVGTNQGLGVPFAQWTAGVPGGLDLAEVDGAGERTADQQGDANTKTAPTEHDGLDLGDRTSPAADWFEHVHVLPRGEIEFGNILGSVERSYEVYNAHRTQAATLATVVNGASPGIDLPDVVAPSQIPPQTSILDSATTGQTTTALGTIVLARLVAQPEGLPTFSAEIVFDFSGTNDVALLISGTRIVLFPFEYEAPLVERLQFYTDIIEAADGQEQRISPREFERQIIEPIYALDGVDRQRAQLLLAEWSANVFGVPLLHEAVRLTAAVSAGATVYPVSGADQVDFRVGGLAAVISDSATHDVLNIAAVTATQITAEDPSLNGYPAGTRLMPVRTARIVGAGYRGSREPVNLERLQVVFTVIDNSTGVAAATTTPGFWSLFGDGRVFLDDCNVIDRAMGETFARKVYTLDNETGIVAQVSPTDRARRGHEKGFTLRSRSQILDFRRLLRALRGRQIAFWIPSHAEDLTPAAGVTIGTATFDVVNVGYERFAQQRLPASKLRITFTDGTRLVRTVTDSDEVSASVEQLTLDQTWPASRTVDEFLRVEFVELVRFDTDEFRIEHERIALAKCRAPVLAVYDDD